MKQDRLAEEVEEESIPLKLEVDLGMSRSKLTENVLCYLRFLASS
jgi:hypothetical protein